MVTVPAADSTKDLENTEWAQMGLMTKFCAVGSTMGPPAEREYPVDPVGVATTTPSPEKMPSWSSPVVT